MEDVLRLTDTFEKEDLRTLRIIQHVKKHKCLWDNNDKNRPDAAKVREAWASVSMSTGIKMDVVKLKWKKLQDMFYSHYSRSEDLTDNSMGRLCLQSMEFLNRRRDIDASQNLNRNNSLSETSTTNKNVENDYDLIEHQGKINTPKIYNTVKKRKHENNVVEDLSNKSSIDGDYLFLVSLLPTLKKLPDYSKMNVRVKIQEIVYKELCAYKEQKENNSYQSDESE